jgi:HlyD family secretion protein
MKHLMRKLLLLAAVLGIATAGGAWYWRRSSSSAVTYRTEGVTRGDLTPTISATGTVEPQEVVDVGAQVAGLISSFGTDAKGKLIDYGSPVNAGTVLARIDDSLYAADATNAQATLEQSKAGVTRAEADLEQMRAKLEQAQSDWERAQKLGPSDALSQSDFISYKAAFETAQANVAVSQAAILQAKATVTQSQAALDRAKQNLDYCTITSPVSGIIIDRRVNIGETVVSSLNAPSLFLIAKDLRQIQVWVSVNEADIGSIHPNQPVTFTVDAYPGETFHGTVGKVRLNAAMTQNVVTYTVEVNTDNSDGRLLPYLTANVEFETAHEKDVLLVPNAALRWYPEDVAMVAPDVREAAKNNQNDAHDDAQSERHHRTREVGATHGVAWYSDGNYVRPIKLTLGASDGILTQVLAGDVHEGEALIEGEERQDAADAGTTNPFAPQIFRRH